MKKQLQLGMNPSTASGRLVKDLLFYYVKDIPCSKCGKPLTRDTFSIEHKLPWLDSENPQKLFFDIDNITYSHLICNIKAGRKPIKGNTKYPEYLGMGRKPHLIANDKARVYSSEKRKQQYLRTGK